MTKKAYLLIATAVFFAAVTGSYVFARITIAGDTLGRAVEEHLLWLSLTPIGVVFLFVPFAGVALLCGAVTKRSGARSAVALFIVALMVLAYFYFDGFQASEQAMLDKRWTAAALSVGLLPFFVGLPVLSAVVIVAAFLPRLGRQQTDQP